MKRGLLVVCCAWFALIGCRQETEQKPAVPAPGTPQAQVSESELNEVRQNAADLYVYAYPLVLMDVTRQNMSARTPANMFEHFRAFPDPSSTDVVSPNADTLYSSAWLDLSGEPVVLSVPKMDKRFYLMPILDAWTNVFTSPGTRTNQNEPGRFAIVGPRWKGQLPEGLTEVRSPTEMAWLIGRTQVNGKADLPAVRKLQDKYSLAPLSTIDQPTKATEQPARAEAAAPQAEIAPPEQVAAMDAQTFFGRVAALLDGNPSSPSDQLMTGKMRRLEIDAGRPFPSSKPPEWLAALREGFRKGMTRVSEGLKRPQSLQNGWAVDTKLGNYGTDYEKRALVARSALGANLAADAIYPMVRVDAQGQELNGKEHYVMHFAKGELPPARAFWSVTVYDDKQHLIENPLRRYALGDRDKLKRNADGSIDIYLQNESPGASKTANWLPTPEGPFNVIMRIYSPKEEVLSGQWTPPPLQRVTAPEARVRSGGSTYAVNAR